MVTISILSNALDDLATRMTEWSGTDELATRMDDETKIAYEWIENHFTKRLSDRTVQDYTNLINDDRFLREVRQYILHMQPGEAEALIMKCDPEEPGHFAMFPECRERLLQSVGLQGMTTTARTNSLQHTDIRGVAKPKSNIPADSLMMEAQRAYQLITEKSDVNMNDIQNRRECKRHVIDKYWPAINKACLIIQGMDSIEDVQAMPEILREYRINTSTIRERCDWRIEDNEIANKGQAYIAVPFESTTAMKTLCQALTTIPIGGNKKPLGKISISFMAYGSNEEEYISKYLECTQLIANITQSMTPKEIDEII